MHFTTADFVEVGQARFQTAVIIEPTIELEELPVRRYREIYNSIADIVKEANIPEPKHAHIKEGFIMFTSSGKPFPRAGKGTVQRAPAVQLYKTEIDALYETQKSSALPVHLDTSSQNALTESLRILCLESSGVRDLAIDDDLFSTGVFDSLSVLTLSRQLKAFFQQHKDVRVQPELLHAGSIYKSRSVRALAGKLYEMVHSKDSGDWVNLTHESTLMEQLFSKYAKDLPTTVQRDSGDSSAEGRKATVILTGSTGSLGSYLLDALLRCSHVEKIICLNRSKDARARQRKTHEINGLPMEGFHRVEFLQAGLHETFFGLEEDCYNDLLRTTTHIIRK